MCIDYCQTVLLTLWSFSPVLFYHVFIIITVYFYLNILNYFRLCILVELVVLDLLLYVLNTSCLGRRDGLTLLLLDKGNRLHLCTCATAVLTDIQTRVYGVGR